MNVHRIVGVLALVVLAAGLLCGAGCKGRDGDSTLSDSVVGQLGEPEDIEFIADVDGKAQRYVQMAPVG